jgi:plastocyanin
MKNMKIKKSKTLSSLLLVFVASLLGFISLGWAEDETNFLDIQVLNMDFKLDNSSLKDQVLVLPVGTELNFINVDPLITSSGLEGLIAHFLFINDQDGKEVARSKIMNKAEEATFHFKFARPGSYTYGCLIHFLMRGKVVVFDVQKINQPEGR